MIGKPSVVLVWAIVLLAAAPAATSFATAPAPITPSLKAALAAAPLSSHEALFSFDGPIADADIQGLSTQGLAVLRVFDAFSVVYAVGNAAQVLAGATVAGVQLVSANEGLSYALDTATVATRAREFWDAKSTSTNPVTVGGNVVDGAGIGVAIIDSGIDATHPDLAPAVGAAKKYVCTTPGLISTATNTCYGNIQLTADNGCGSTPAGALMWVDMDDTDTTSGHGTHVAGIVAGRGVASAGRFMGAAPGATLYSLSVGEGLSILFALEALNWVHCNHASVTPAIRVVSNSWGISGGSAYSPSDPINLAVDTLVSDGLVVLFAVGNDGGTGSSNVISGYAKNPTPGVIGVANYYDADTATPTGGLDASSSRGATSGTAGTWPDVSAPGTFIMSTMAKTNALAPVVFPGLTYLPYYAEATGTSMATPHVAGVAALLLQANASLTPADVEDILEDTAVAFSTTGGYGATDSSNPTAGINFAAGHGLVDAVSALEDARVLNASGLGSPLPQLSQNPHVYTEGTVDPEVAAGIPGTIELQWTEVAGRPVTLAERSLVSGDTTAWPLSVGQSAAFYITGPGGTSTLTTSVAADGTGFRADVSTTFASPGAYTVESQIDFGSGLVSFDSFVVRIVP